MGAADIVPGVSGGTIALITGIYEELITTIKNINLDLFKSFFASGYKKFWIELNGNFLYPDAKKDLNKSKFIFLIVVISSS